MLRLSSVLSAIVGLVIALINKIFYSYSLWSYLLLFLSLLFFYVMSFVIQSHNSPFWSISILVNLYIFTFMSIVIILSILPARQNLGHIGIYFFLFLIVIPSIFLLSIQNTLINVSIYNILFIVLQSTFKVDYLLFYLNIAFSILSSLVGILLYLVFSSLRIKDQNIKFILSQQSKRDELSNLPNRRHFNQYLQESYLVCLRENQSLGVVMIDIDDFKNVNDLSGHIFGDIVVRKFGNLLLDSSIDNEIFFARYGGDEFIGVFRDFSLEEITNKMTHISEQFNNMFSQNKVEDITISVGIAMLDNENLEELVNNADSALKIAKVKGKNCIEVYKEEG